MIGAVAVLAALGLAWTIQFQWQVRPPMTLAIAEARRSSEIHRLLGDPLNASPIAKGHLIGDGSNGNADFDFGLHGPLGKGTLVGWAQVESSKWTFCSLEFRLSGGSKVITLVDEAHTHCERE
jgi:hypothetical protein